MAGDDDCAAASNMFGETPMSSTGSAAFYCTSRNDVAQLASHCQAELQKDSINAKSEARQGFISVSHVDVQA
jgi:hypothetical protein